MAKQTGADKSAVYMLGVVNLSVGMIYAAVALPVAEIELPVARDWE